MSNALNFPKLSYEQILPTSEAIHSYARLLGAIRAGMTPEQKDYWHISLRTATQGFRTTPIPNVDGSTFELSLNLLTHNVSISSSTGHNRSNAVNGQSISKFSEELLSALETIGIKPEIDLEKFTDTAEQDYDPATASEIFRSYSLVDNIFKKYKGTITQETSPVQLWPHHMDVAFTIYTPSVKDNLEQVGFGYLTGDESVPEPYFYISPWPEIEDIDKVKLLDDARWNTEGWQGVVLKYADLINKDDPSQTLYDHLKITFEGILRNV